MSEYGRFDLRYVRTDKNGTKIYNDINCPRCCGYGELEQWAYTGRVCFACGGTGRRPKPKTVKIYTPEYAEKLKRRRLAKLEKQLADNPPPSEEELQRRADEARRNAWQSEGFDRDGVGYVHKGNTYPNREKFRRAGGRWNSYMRAFICPVKLELDGVEVLEAKAQDMCNVYGYVDPEKAWEFIGK